MTLYIIVTLYSIGILIASYAMGCRTDPATSLTQVWLRFFLKLLWPIYLLGVLLQAFEREGRGG